MNQSPHIAFQYPTSNYATDEDIPVLLLPVDKAMFEIVLVPASSVPPRIENNRVVIPQGLSPGSYVVKARCSSANDSPDAWSEWAALRFRVHEAGPKLDTLRIRDHQLETMIERGLNRTITIIDPDALPPAAIELAERKWFPTAVYEGATPILNEDEDYYRDPMAYYLEAIDHLKEKGARFVTWHDLLDGEFRKTPLEILVQFDVDGGPRSMKRLFEALAARDARATIMTHRRGHYWYPYEMEDFGFEWLRQAEKAGWAIGYHNNTLSQVIGNSDDEVYTPDRLVRAANLFRDDASYLSRHFDLRTFTHHGGNLYNSRVVAPEDCRLVGVDRFDARDLWRHIDSSFSDGGFLSRPTTLRRKVEGLTLGLHFFRNHPLKYANYQDPVDAPPRSEVEAARAGMAGGPEAATWRVSELAKEAEWLHHRRNTRSPVRFGYSRMEKPISARFPPFAGVGERVASLRQGRGGSFLRLYPWIEGDPRVFWWRMLEAWGPKQGDVLNVGALPVADKNQNEYFLSPEVRVFDCDIDAKREPTYLFDVADAPADMNGRFVATLLFGLPYFSRPSEAVAACERLTQPGGASLFGFAAATNPERGSLWNPHNRHLWRKEKEPLQDIGLRGNLWAFDDEGLADLFSSWPRFRAEFMNHYWFVVADKDV